MISIVFRCILVVVSLYTMFFMIRKIRKYKVQINYSIFWIGFSLLLLFFSIFPECAVWAANLLGIYSSTNFIFLAILFVIIIKLFNTTIELSNLEYKIKELSQKIALEENIKNEMDSYNKIENGIKK